MRKTAVKKGKSPATTSSGDTKTKSTARSTRLPLESVRCCVETFNSDGVDSSNGFIQILKELGAQIETGGIRAGLTHMVWSNGNLKHLRAAEFMDIIAISPLWVEQCRESNSRAPEGDFLVTADNVTVSTSRSRVSEPVPDAADALPEPDSPSLNSSKRVSKSKAKQPATVMLKVTPPKKGKRGEVSEVPPPVTQASKKKSRKSVPVASDSEEEEDQEEEVTPVAVKVKKPAAKKAGAAEKKSDQKKKNPSSASTTSDPNCRMIALSGFEGEDRGFMADLLQSIITSVPANSSSSSPTSYGLLEDNDFSIPSLINPAYIVASTDPMKRSLRVLFGMVLGIPIVTAGWIHSCLEHNKWVDTSEFLHPRFDRSKAVLKMKNKKQPAKISIFVAVGTSSNPSKDILCALVENWCMTRLASSAAEADYVIIDHELSGLTIYEMRVALAKLFPKKSADVNHVLSLLEEGQVLTSKMLFDCIEEGEVKPHHFPASSPTSDPQPKRSQSRKGTPKKGKVAAAPAPAMDEEEVEEMARLYVAPPVRLTAGPPLQKSRRGAPLPVADEDEEDEAPVKVLATKRSPVGRRAPSPVIPVAKSRGEDEEEEEEEYVAPVKVPATKKSNGRGARVPSPVITDKGDLTPMRGRKGVSTNDNGTRKRVLSPDVDDEEDEDVSPTPVKVPASKRSRSSPSPSSPSPLRLRLPVQDSDDEWNEDRGLPSAVGEEASPSW